jgi:hypothetical protein
MVCSVHELEAASFEAACVDRDRSAAQAIGTIEHRKDGEDQRWRR